MWKGTLTSTVLDADTTHRSIGNDFRTPRSRILKKSLYAQLQPRLSAATIDLHRAHGRSPSSAINSFAHRVA
eukprot:6185814-Pleurochrysis_carterae.AAC.6